MKRFEFPKISAIPASAFQEREFNPEDMESIFCFDSPGWKTYRALFKDKLRDRLYLAEAFETSEGITIQHSAEQVPIAESVAKDFHLISVKAALEWWVRCRALVRLFKRLHE